VIGAALPAASILAAETEEVEGWRLLIPAVSTGLVPERLPARPPGR
jgi:hypothetical protein